MMNFIAALHHLFLPRDSNNYRAKLVHPSFALGLSVLFFLAHFAVGHLASPHALVLGYAANISPAEVVNLTNERRLAVGEEALSFSNELSGAARLKGLHMLEHGYWSHVAPDGTEPWYFFNQVGYTYRFAGENLARDFTNPASVVEAWMASPSHRDNMLSGKYQEIGIAVVEGHLDGKDTTIVVQLFGTRSRTPASVPVAAADSSLVPQAQAAANESKIDEGEEEDEDDAVVAAPALSQTPPVYQPIAPVTRFEVMRTIALGSVVVLTIVFALDIIIVGRRGVSRIGGRSFAHLTFLSMILLVLLLAKTGEIL